MTQRALGIVAGLVLTLVLTGCTSSKSTTNTDTSRSTSEDAQTGEGRVIDITAEDALDMAFSVREIRAKRGETITVNFTSKDGIHNWTLDAFDVATRTVSTGQTDSVTFVADQAGTFEYYCAVGNHRDQGLVGTLIVE